MLNTYYDPKTVAFEQESCRICLTDYQEHDRIVELACKHIFCPDCVQAIVRCPKCEFPIAGRSRNPSREEIEAAINEFVMNALALSPGLAKLHRESPEVSRQFQNEVATKIQQQITGQIIQPIYDPLAQLKDFTNTLRIIVDGEPEALTASMKRHAAYLAEGALELYQSRPVVIDKAPEDPRSYSEFLSFVVGFVESLGGINSKARKYVTDVVEMASTDTRITEIYQAQKAQFIELHRVRLVPLNALQRYNYIRKLDVSSKKLVTTLPESRTAKKIDDGVTKVLETLFIVSLFIVVTALVIDT